MRSALVGLVAVVMACKSGGKPADKQEPNTPSETGSAGTSTAAPAVAAKPLDLVRVTDARAVATLAGKPPVLVVIDGANKTYLAAADTLDELGTRDVLSGAKPASVQQLERIIIESWAFEISPSRVVKDFDPNDLDLDLGTGIDLAALENMRDDPPPPEEEDYPDDGTDVTAAKPTETPRAEGTYRMKMQSAEPARVKRDEPPAASVPPTDRAGLVRGKVVDQLTEQRALILASPRASSRALLEIVHNTRGAIAVAHEQTVRPLRIQFFFRAVHRDAAIAAVKGTELPLTKDTDLAKLTAGLDLEQPIDLFVADTVDAQRIIDALVALELAGVQFIGIGPDWK